MKFVQLNWIKHLKQVIEISTNFTNWFLGICLVEWSERLHPDIRPKEYLSVDIEPVPEEYETKEKSKEDSSESSEGMEGDEERIVTIVAHGERWIKRLKEIEDDLYSLQ